MTAPATKSRPPRLSKEPRDYRYQETPVKELLNLGAFDATKDLQVEILYSSL